MKKGVLLLLEIVLLLLLIIALPVLINNMRTSDSLSIVDTLVTTLHITFPLIIVFLLNFFLLVPYLFYKNYRVGYVVTNLVLVLLINHNLLLLDVELLPKMARGGFYVFLVVLLIINLLVAASALGVKYVIRSYKLQERMKEEQQKSVEAELHWLKHQLNPHFLFNTLNNISSLTQIDADAAQESIAQLSDLLRYALYQSNCAKVALAGEVEFIRNYVQLMKLRCTDKATIELDITVEDPQLLIAPLLFISPIENAFKHGLSGNKLSFIDVKLSAKASRILFVCRNSNFPNSSVTRSDSGIGTENLLRRLELIYPNQYLYRQTLDEEVYQVEIEVTL